MIVIGSGIGVWVAEKCGMVWTPENSQAIGLKSGDEIVAGVWYEDYNSVSVMAHIAVTGRMTRDYLWTIFDYPFVQLGVRKIVCPILEDNSASIRLATKMGFREESRLKDIHPSGDLIFHTMRREDCRYLGERYGKECRSATGT